MTFARRAFVIICWLYVVLLPVQVLLAGYGIMGGDIEVHEGFGALVLALVIPLLMLLTGLLGRLWRLALLGLLLGILLHANMFLPSQDNNWVAGLHPMFAVLSWPYVWFLMLLPARRRIAGDGAVVVAETVPAPGA
jgi:hypothetical protein